MTDVLIILLRAYGPQTVIHSLADALRQYADEKIYADDHRRAPRPEDFFFSPYLKAWKSAECKLWEACNDLEAFHLEQANERDGK